MGQLFRQTLFILTIISLTSCTLDNNYVRQRVWKYGNGFWLRHDFIRFGGGYFKLNNDTIFIGDSAVATIFETEKGYFGDDNEIHIKSISTKEIGVYHDLGPINAKDTAVEIILTPPPADINEPPVPETPPKPSK